MAAPYEGMYAKLKFPPFKYQEFPKIVRGEKGEPIQVASRTEELEHYAKRSMDVPEDAVSAALNERDDLASQLAVMQARMADLEKENASIKLEAAAKISAMTPAPTKPLASESATAKPVLSTEMPAAALKTE